MLRCKLSLPSASLGDIHRAALEPWGLLTAVQICKTMALQACGMYLPWNLEARTYDMQSHAMSIRSTSSPFAFGCQFGDIGSSQKKRVAADFDDRSASSDLLSAQSSTIDEFRSQQHLASSPHDWKKPYTVNGLLKQRPYEGNKPNIPTHDF